MSDILQPFRTMAANAVESPRLLWIFAAWRLRAYGFGIAVVYAVVFIYVYAVGAWIITRAGEPIYTDFSTSWVAGLEALHGNPAALYDSAEFLKSQTALLGENHSFYENWPYPPTFFLIMAPFALLPYLWSFLTWDFVTLSCFITVVFLIVRQSPAVSLVLACPYTAWNFLGGQNGCLMASLLGASLLLLERRPALAGFFIGCLTYKPQFGILIPVALVAGKRWRAVASTLITFAFLVIISIIFFGPTVWLAFPRAVVFQASMNLTEHPQSNWGLLQTIYGLLWYVKSGAVPAWVGQGTMTFGLAAIVWVIWRSQVCYALKAAVLSAAAVLATPYAFAYDLAAIAVPVAFLARDQMRCGLLRGEQTILLGLFVIILVPLVTFALPSDGVNFGSVPIGPIVLLTIFGIVLRRIIKARLLAPPAIPENAVRYKI